MKKFKCVFTLLIMLFISAQSFAQAPQKLNYQAVCRDNIGSIIASQSVTFRLSIHDLTPSGTIAYQETQTTITNMFGLVNLELGSGTVQSGNFDSIPWATGAKYLEIEIDLGAGYVSMGTSQLLSVPYALYAKTADSITGGSSGFTHYIGELYGGGIVVAVWKEAGIEKGLIASLVDVSASATWSSITGTLIGATAQSPFDGQANTTAIVAEGDVGGAAFLCDNYTSGGFSDWYLPAAWELNQCYNAAFIVNTILGATNGFQFDTYWSSTEGGSVGRAWAQNFFNVSFTSTDNKASIYRVRAVRKF